MESLTLEELVFQALGAASTCWESPEDAGVFDSTRCKEVGEELLEALRLMMNVPRLGCATTLELADELRCRIELAMPVQHTVR